MLKANRFMAISALFFVVLFPSFLLSVSLSVPAWAERSENNPPASSFTHEKDSSPLLRGVRGVSSTFPFTLEATDNLINLQAEQASFKEILNDLEKKTGIKVNIFDGEGFMNTLHREYLW